MKSELHSYTKSTHPGIFSGPIGPFWVTNNALQLSQPPSHQKVHNMSHDTPQTWQILLTNLCEGLDQRVVLDDGVVVVVVALSVPLCVVGAVRQGVM